MVSLESVKGRSQRFNRIQVRSRKKMLMALHHQHWHLGEIPKRFGECSVAPTIYY
jgi:hypothetical protein